MEFEKGDKVMVNGIRSPDYSTTVIDNKLSKFNCLMVAQPFGVIAPIHVSRLRKLKSPLPDDNPNSAFKVNNHN